MFAYGDGLGDGTGTLGRGVRRGWTTGMLGLGRAMLPMLLLAGADTPKGARGAGELDGTEGPAAPWMATMGGDRPGEERCGELRTGETRIGDICDGDSSLSLSGLATKRPGPRLPPPRLRAPWGRLRSEFAPELDALTGTADAGAPPVDNVSVGGAPDIACHRLAAKSCRGGDGGRKRDEARSYDGARV